jgi:hypothetical protein
VSVGDEHACVLLEDASVRCWGRGTHGRLGYGDEESLGDDEPLQAIPPVELGGPAVAIDAGTLASCAVLADGTARCWGACASPLAPTGIDTTCLGQLGDPQTTPKIGDDDVPTDYPAIELGGLVIADVSMGSYHACLLGHLRPPMSHVTSMTCWGDDIEGSDGSTKTNGDPPEVQLNWSIGPFAAAWRRVRVGSTHACASAADSETRAIACWGRGDAGATGYGTTEDVGEDDLIAAYGLVEIPEPRDFDTGNELSCAVTLDDEIYCWGAAAGPSGLDGAHGHPGIGNIGDDETPVGVGPVSVW